MLPTSIWSKLAAALAAVLPALQDKKLTPDSITERLLPLGDDVTFVPGHGLISTFGNERRTNPFLAG